MLVPWLDVDPDATLVVEAKRQPVKALLAELDPAERDGVRRTGLGAHLMGPTRNRDLTAATVIAAFLGYLLVSALYRVVPADHRVDRTVAAGGGHRRGRLGVLRAGQDQRRARSATRPVGCTRWPLPGR